jgi:hypothetical protein
MVCVGAWYVWVHGMCVWVHLYLARRSKQAVGSAHALGAVWVASRDMNCGVWCTADGAALVTLVNTILHGDARLASMLLVNPVEVVELACEDPAWQPAIADALGVTLPTEGDVSSSGEQATVLSAVLLDAVKRLKSPSWAYPTEVQGLLREAVARVTGGKHHSLEEVCGIAWWTVHLP